MKLKPMDLDAIFDLLHTRGGAAYLGEDITQVEHALQAATLAEEAGEDAHLIVACLLHDVGHLVVLEDGSDESAGDDRHEVIGAKLLAAVLPPGVTEPIRLHVEAKRYLVTKDPGYRATLSAASEYSLQAQGGPMSDDACARFEAEPHAGAAIALRRYEEAAMVVDARTWPLEHFRHFAQACILRT